LLHATYYVPENEVEDALTAFHQGDCPCCGGPGPVDYHLSYRIMSLLAVSQFKMLHKIACQSCAQKAKLRNFLITLFIGWWGPGFIFTPFYLWNNLHSMIYPIPGDAPSDRLREYIRLNLARQRAADAAAKAATEGDMPFASG